jgi:hypothetical protein
MPWLKPSLALRWGSYTKLDGDEQQKIVDATLKSYQGGLITRRMAVEKLKPVYGIENVDAVLEALEKEDKEKADKALAQTQAEQASLHALTKKNDEGGAGGASKEEPAGAPGG